jgi:hypothetical protein
MQLEIFTLCDAAMLCGDCNRGIGIFRDTLEGLKHAERCLRSVQ